MRDIEDKMCIVMGDLNAHLGALENGRNISAAGERLLDNFANRGFILTNDRVPTYYSSSNESYTELLDVCFMRTGGNDIRWTWDSRNCFTSDHNLTSIELKTQMKKI